MTDPRIEAAARCLFGDKVYQSSGAREYLLGEVKKALAAADAAAWRPIMTAPMDGNQVIGYEGDDFCIVKNIDNDWWGDAGYIFEPTHWQPLPAPPKTQNT